MIPRSGLFLCCAAAAIGAQGTTAVQQPPEFLRGKSGTAPRGTGPTHGELLSAGTTGYDWLTHTRDYAGSRYSPLARIRADNVARLRPVCRYEVGSEDMFQTGPIVYRGTMFITTVYSTYALDAATCRLKWRHDWQRLATQIRIVNRGVAVKDGRVVRGTTDGYLVALDARTGGMLWARRVADAERGETFSMPPLIYDSLVFIGPAVSASALKGWVGAFRLSDGRPVWRFNIVPRPGEPGAETWDWRPDVNAGGGAVWTPFSLDPARDLLYVATATAVPMFASRIRGGVNLYANSMVVLHARTGKLAWYDQMVPADEHDWDLTQVSPLYQQTVGGRRRNLVATAGKDGMLRVVDRDTRERVFQSAVTTIRNAKAPVTRRGTHACPGSYGGVLWNGPALHPGANVLAVPAVDWCHTFFVADTVRYVPDKAHLGGRSLGDSAWRGWVTGVDASTGTIRWRHYSPGPVVGAVTATAGGLFFIGELSGDLKALDAVTGAERFRYNTGAPIGAGIVTYEVGGRQYVAVGAGGPSDTWSEGRRSINRIVVLALPER